MRGVVTASKSTVQRVMTKTNYSYDFRGGLYLKKYGNLGLNDSAKELHLEFKDLFVRWL